MRLTEIWKCFLSGSLVLLLAAPAFAQYGGGTTGSGASNGTYTAPKGGYGSGAGIE